MLPGSAGFEREPDDQRRAPHWLAPHVINKLLEGGL
jgi:hypothetical protein